MTKDNLLQDITVLSHEFGIPEYVKGGGGNTSVKDDRTVWVKPSGTTLATIKKEDFIPLDRTKLEYIFDFTPPSVQSKREAAVKDLMTQAVASDTAGRPSVEAPLHHCFEARYVVHTHPSLINGMLCAREGKEACERLFPDALWLDYVDPGYTLAVAVRKKLEAHRRKYGKQPGAVFIQNHGVFVGVDNVDKVREIYAGIMQKLADHYREKGVAQTLTKGMTPSEQRRKEIRKIFQTVTENADITVLADGKFKVPAGPLTPDHIVYMKSHPFRAEPKPHDLIEFRDQHGYLPAIVVADDGVFAVGDSEKKARLALELAQDGALVEQLADAFGGVKYMTDKQRDFIDNWEVEAYRKQQV